MMPSSRSDDRSDADEPRSGASSADTFRSLADSDEAYARTLQNAVDNDEDPDDGDEGFQSVRTRPRRTNNTSNTGGLQTGSASASSRSGYEHGAPGSIGDRLVATGERITGKIGRLVKDSDFSFLIQLDKEKEFGFTHWFLGQKKNFCYKSQEALALRDGTGANADRVSLRLKYNPQKKSDPTQKFVADAIIVKHKDIPTDVFFNGPPQGVYDPNLNASSSSGTSRAVRRTRQDLYETGDRIEGTCCKIHLGQKGYALLMSPEMEGKVLLGAKFFPVEKSLDEGDRVSFKVTPNTFKEGEYMALDVMHVEGGGGSRYSNSASGAFGAGAGSSSGDREQGAQGAGAGQGSAAGGQVSLTSFPGPAVPSGPSAITTPKSSGASAGSGAAASGGAGISSAASRVPAASKPPLVGHAVPPAATRQAGTLSKSSSESGSKLTTQQLACFSRLELAFTKQRIRARVIKSLPGTKGYSNALVTSSQIQDDDLNEPQGGTVLALQKRVVRDNWVFMPFCEGQVVEFSLCENPAPPDGGEDVSRKFLADEIEFPELMQSTELRNSIGLTQKLHFPARMEWEIALSSGKLFTGEIVSTHQSPGDHSSTSTYSDYCFVQAPELRQSMLAHRNRFADNYKDVVELKKGMQLQFRVIRNPHEWVHDRKFPYVADQIKPIFSFKAGAGTGPVAAGEVVTNLASATTSGSGAVLGAGGVSMSSWSTMLKTKSVTKSTSATADEPAEATQFALVASIQTETIVGATGQHVARKRMEIPENFFTGGGADGGGGGSSSQRRQLRAVELEEEYVFLDCFGRKKLKEGDHLKLKAVDVIQETTAKGAKKSSGSRLDSIEDNEEEVEAEAQEGGYEQLQEESQRGRAGPLAALAVFLDGLVARLRSLPLPERGEQVSRIGESPEYKRFKQRVAHCSLAQTKGELLKLLKHDHRFEIRNEAPASQPAKNYWAYLKNDSNYATSANGSFDVLEQYYQLVEEILLENGGAAARVDTGQLEADPRIGELMRSHPVPWADAKGPLMHILYACPDTNRFTLEVDRSRSYTVKLGRENKHAEATAPLLQALEEQKAQNEKLQSDMAKLQGMVATLMQRLPGVEVMGADAVFLDGLVTTLRSLPKRGMLLSSIGTSPEYKAFKQQVETDPQRQQTKGKAALLKLLQDDSRFEIRNTAPASQPAKIYWAFLNQAPDRSEAGKEEETQALEKYYQAFEAILLENGGRAVCCDNQQLGTDSRIRELKRSNPMGSLRSILHRCPDQGRFEIKHNHQVDAGSVGAYAVKLGPGNKYADASSSSAGCAGAPEQGAERPWWVPDAELFTRFWDVIEQILREHAHAAGTRDEAVDPAAITSDIRYQALKAELPGSNLTLRRIIRHCEDPGRFQLVDPRSEGGTTTYAVKLGKSWSSSVNRGAGDHGGQHQQQQNFDSNSTTLQLIQEATAPLLRALEEQRAQNEKLQAEQKAQSEKLQAGMAKLQGMVASTLVY
eukprot:g4467.t1